MGSSARRQGRRAESPPGAIQDAMVGKLAPEVKRSEQRLAADSGAPAAGPLRTRAIRRGS